MEITSRAAVVLDGASSFAARTVPADEYVDYLSAWLIARIQETIPLKVILANAIKAAVKNLDLIPGQSPSSTVLLMREVNDMIEILTLGDSSVLIGYRNGSIERIVDDRIAQAGTRVRSRMRRRLQRGHGFDRKHHELLAKVQKYELAARNREGGYWIAEADTAAADYAVTTVVRWTELRWIILVTDGFQRPFDYLGLDWSILVDMTVSELQEISYQLHKWEDEVDPAGKTLPRSKRHDDKSVAIWKPQQQ